MRAASPRLGAWFLVACMGLVAPPPVRPQPEPERTVLTTADSVRVAAFWYANPEAPSAPVAVLLHNPGATHHAWQPLTTRLYRAGFQVLAIDLRGHGDSKELSPEVYEQLRRRDAEPYRRMIHDVEAAVRWLVTARKVPDERIALVGGEYAANLGLQALARNRDLGAVVAMSPSKYYFQFPLVETAKKCGNKPLLFIVPKQLQGAGIAEFMRRNPNFEMKRYPRFERHGVYMLGLSWDLEGLITKWLAEVFGLPSS
jgi:pimeloyl-ACP methyl ester carboxylesterase